MNISSLEGSINQAWEEKDTKSPETTGVVREAVQESLGGFDAGTYRVAEK